jgi:hypothetical protein
MKRLAIGLALVSLVAVSLVLPVAASTYAGDANVTWVVSDDGTVGWLYVQNAGSTAAPVVRLALGAAAVIEGGYTTFWDGSYQYVLLPTALAPGSYVALALAGAGGTAIGLTGVELGSYYTWFTVPVGTQATVDTVVGGPVVVKSADGAVNTLFMVSPATAARFVRLSGSDVAVGSGYATFSDGSYLYVDLGVPTVAGGVTAVTLLGGEVASAELGSWVLWSVAADATSAVLTVRNFGTSAANQLFINFVRNAIVDLANSFVHKTNWTSVAFALTDTENAFVPAKGVRSLVRTWDAAVNGDGTIQRFWLPVEVLPFEYVIVKVTMASATEAIKVFKAELGFFVP